MKPSLFLLPLLLAAPALFAQDSALLDLLPPDTQIVVGLHVHGVVDSMLARTVAQDIQKAAGGDWQKLIGVTGFDPLHDLDEVLFASTGQGEKAPTLIVARGTFDIARLAPNGESYNGVTLVAGPNAKQGVFGFLDGTTAVAGDAELVKAAIDRRSSPTPLGAELSARIAEYRQQYEVWGIINRAEGLTQYLPKSSQSNGLESIDRFQFGVGLKHGLEVAAEVHARSAKDAEQLAATLQFFEAMTRASQPASAGTKFAVKNAEGTLKISLSISEEDLQKAIETQRKAGMMRTMTTTPPPTPTPAPAAPVAAPRPPVRALSAADSNTAPPASLTDGGTAVFTLPSPQ